MNIHDPFFAANAVRVQNFGEDVRANNYGQNMFRQVLIGNPQAPWYVAVQDNARRIGPAPGLPTPSVEAGVGEFWSVAPQTEQQDGVSPDYTWAGRGISTDYNRYCLHVKAQFQTKMYNQEDQPVLVGPYGAGGFNQFPRTG